MKNSIKLIFITLISVISFLSCQRNYDPMVVAAHPSAAEFGLTILNEGGNAVDAAVGTAIMIGGVEPHASGLGGGGGILIYLNDQDSLTYINYYQRAPQNIASDFDRDTDLTHAKAALVPGTVAGLSLALEQYGTMSWKKILTMSSDWLKKGFVVDQVFYSITLDHYEALLNDSQINYIYQDFFTCIIHDSEKLRA